MEKSLSSAFARAVEWDPNSSASIDEAWLGAEEVLSGTRAECFHNGSISLGQGTFLKDTSAAKGFSVVVFRLLFKELQRVTKNSQYMTLWWPMGLNFFVSTGIRIEGFTN